MFLGNCFLGHIFQPSGSVNIWQLSLLPGWGNRWKVSDVEISFPYLLETVHGKAQPASWSIIPRFNLSIKHYFIANIQISPDLPVQQSGRHYIQVVVCSVGWLVGCMQRLRFILLCKSKCQPIFLKKQDTYSCHAKLWLVRTLIKNIHDSSHQYLSNVTFGASLAFNMREEWLFEEFF